MITSTYYLRPNITIETELVGWTKFFIYNYQGIHYRVFRSLNDLSRFLMNGEDACSFDGLTEVELEKYLKLTELTG